MDNIDPRVALLIFKVGSQLGAAQALLEAWLSTVNGTGPGYTPELADQTQAWLDEQGPING
jgi:hypothetical protein